MNLDYFKKQIHDVLISQIQKHLWVEIKLKGKIQMSK